MTRFASLDELRSACLDLPGGHREKPPPWSRAAKQTLTKPPGSLAGSKQAVRGSRFGRGRTRRGSARSRSWCSPAIMASPRKASRPIRPRSPRRWWPISPPAAPPSISSRSLPAPSCASSRSTSIIRRPISPRARHGRGGVSRRRVGRLRRAFARGRSRGAGRDGHRQYHRGLGDRGGVVRRRRRALRRPRHRRRRSGLERKRAAIDAALARHARSSAIRCASPPRLAGASLPPSSAPRSPRGIGASRRCSTASSAPPPWRHGPSSAPTRSTMRLPVMCRPRRDIGCCLRSLACIRCSISACGSAKARAPPSPCWCCAPRSPAIPAWRLSREARCRTRTLSSWRWRGRTCR